MKEAMAATGIASATAPYWFVALPDRDLPEGGRLSRLRMRATRAGIAGDGERADSVVSYPSGRPWLLGSWPREQLVTASAGTRMLAVVGTSSATGAGLAARLKRVRTVADLEEALSGLHGSFHVAASLNGHGYLRGSASGARRVYRARIGGATVCADRARTLAWLLGTGPDTARLAASLASPQLPYPLSGAAMWTGVHLVPPGQALRLPPDGACRTTTWWQPPPAELPLHEGASHLREALRRAVSLRVRPGSTLAADLSGGMDSTSLCFLAAEAGASLVTATLHWDTAGNEDHHYARYAADQLPGAQPLVFSTADLPPCFAGLGRRHDPVEEPSVLLRDRARQQHVAGALRARGALLRLSGHGGDHALVPPATYLQGLLRRSPATALRHTAGFRARDRWPLWATARMLLRDGPYSAWLTEAADRLSEPAPHLAGPESWGPRPVLPAWASEQAEGHLSTLLRSAAEHAEPLAADPGRQSWIQQVQEAGRVAALLRDGTSLDGLPMDSPFCDDAVLEACLAVRPHEAGHPWSYKPLLAAAMAGLVPARLLARTTKDHCGPEWHDGLRTNRRLLAAWADTSHLVAAGVADETRLRRALLSPGLDGGGAPALENTLGAEEWLRDLAAHPTPAYLAHDPLEEHPLDPAAP
ncbi:asparagine synthase-related protein [Streptomyces iconiensis]|uniref:Asparagine synthase-related protein n=1 Tax=Streptomyces iconiensis TaxID=1384038 RepID=A0ABT6ZZK5_9ACTN|nr:asparagine synthase-related protein [Streptomyces iconiensis]MDJ1134489.1 asparagine synthase-related protein [Streptomyces iconiensis]